MPRFHKYSKSIREKLKQNLSSAEWLPKEPEVI